MRKGRVKNGRAFQEAAGLEATGTADAVTQLLAAAMAEEPAEMEGIPDPEVMFAPILGKTSADLTAIMESGLKLEYDDFSGEGFISDGKAIYADLSGASELDKYQMTVKIGFRVQQNDAGTFDVEPAIRVSCLCVRRPVMNTLTVKAGDKRGSAEIGKLTVRLDGIYTVEEGVCPLTDEVCEALAGAAEAGELKIRITGQYGEFDVEAGKDALEGAGAIGKIAAEMR